MMAEQTIDYFQIFGLNPDDKWKDNIEKLRELGYRYNEASTTKAVGMQALVKQALKEFAQEADYNAYVRKLKATEQQKQRRWSAKNKREIAKKEAEIEALKQQVADAKRQKQAPVPPPAPPEEAPKDWKGVLLNLGKTAVKSYIEAKQTQRGQPQQPQMRLPTPSINGWWVSGDGIRIQFAQSGNQLQFQGFNLYGAVVTQGNGTIQGTQVTIHYQLAFGYTQAQGQANLQLSADGRHLTGPAQNNVAGRHTMHLMKQQ
ncbi:MAG: hypothetical protein AAF614_05980 [Chloroflexota bacterium]